MPQNKEVHKKYVKVHRIAQKLGVTIDGLIEDEQGYYYKELMGGLSNQRWYPGRLGYHPEGCACGIKHNPLPSYI